MKVDSFPRGFVPKVQPSRRTEQDLFGYNEDIEFVQVKFNRSSWFVNHRRESFLSPNQKLVVNTMEEDKFLIDRTPEIEFDRLVELDGIADVAFAGDRMTYERMRSREILKEIERSVKGQLVLHRMMEDAELDISLYPTITGWKPWHYEHSRVLFGEFDTRSCGFDATQYDSKHKLSEDLGNLVEVLKPERIYLNGCISSDRLRDVPREVVAFSGLRTLLDKIEPPSGGFSRELLREEIERRIQAIHSWQATLADYQPEQEITGD